MNNISSEAQASLRSAIIESVNKFGSEEDFQVITDIHIQFDADTGTLIFSDDEDVEITRVAIEEWIDADGEEIQCLVVSPLKDMLRQVDAEKAFVNIPLSKPFTFVFEDENHETIEELHFVDDDNIILTTDLLKGLDKELDEFLLDLMKED
ncbi:MAG: hypothetical protein KBS99_01715 [Prevotellaceae bacterium]|nr:hypothetical protein [Candidatus Colivivens caballi]